MVTKVSFLGYGNLASNLAYNFDLAGVEIYQVIGRNKDKANSLARKYGGFHSDNIADFFPDADFLMLCVPDDKIKELSAQIPSSFRGVVCHCAGAVGINELHFSGKMGVFYPLQSFRKGDPISMLDVPLMVEGDTSSIEKNIASLADKVSNKVVFTNSQDRANYHLSAVIVNNFGNALFTMANEFLTSKNLNFSLLHPIIEETASRLNEDEPEKWQTGPAKRRDNVTIEKHLEMIDNQELKEFYKKMSNYIMTKP